MGHGDNGAIDGCMTPRLVCELDELAIDGVHLGWLSSKEILQ